MAVLSTIRNFFLPRIYREPEIIVPAPLCEYDIRPLTIADLNEVLRLNIRCFRDGDNYTKYTFDYLLNDPRTISYRAVTDSGEMVGFAFMTETENGAGHLTTLGIAPEHRRRGLARTLLSRIEKAAKDRELTTVILEVRAGNMAAKELYIREGYNVMQRIRKYYNNGEDCFLMMKSVDSYYQ
ncbi:MAG TPA: ribosomal protein S18-alanine N-acetyltransferase [Pyrinomonadaceae bacterium]|nr:ribosomal protein S18-alanine N-acetyltransferase [Pyrinomonadaceae bacterium]